MIRRPRRSPPFPYPPLSRSPSFAAVFTGTTVRARRLAGAATAVAVVGRELLLSTKSAAASSTRYHRQVRSEEHTSELQSRQYLVCRLLLEKKNKSRRTTHT